MAVSFAGLYSQNFDGLAPAGAGLSWTNNLTLPGWFLYRQSRGGPVELTTYSAGNGSSHTGTLISYGSTNSSDRALGGLGSGGAYFGAAASSAVAGWFALALRNTTGFAINNLDISFNGEQWRNGGNTSSQALVLQRGYGSTFQNVSSWITPGGTFNWSSPIASTRAGAVDGNAGGRVGGRGGTLDLSASPWAPNSTLWLRWVVPNNPGDDHGLAIDDLTITAPPGVTLAVAPATGVTEDGPANLIYTFTRTGPTTSPLDVNYTVGGTATLGSDYTGIATSGAIKTVRFLAGSATATVTVDPTADPTIEPDETVTLTLAAGTSNSVGKSYTLGTTTAVAGLLRNDDLPTYTLTPSATQINEGDLLTTTASTTGVASGTTLHWAVSGTGIEASDFSAGLLTGSGQVDRNGRLSISHTLRNDQTSEGNERLHVRVYSDAGRTRQVGNSASVTVVDSSRTPPTQANTITATSVVNGSIASRGEVDPYPVDVSPGAIIRARVTAANSDLSPLVELRHPDGSLLKNPIAYNGNSADLGMVDLLTGKATIHVKTQAGRTGAYTLTVSVATRTELKTEVIRLTNMERQQAGLAPLKSNNLLEQAAESHVRDMDAKDRYLAHTGSNGSSPVDRIKATGYKAAWVDLGNGFLRTIASENAATGPNSATEVVQAWMNSSGHRAAIMDAATKDIGVGFEVDDQTGMTYWVQNFGYPWAAGLTPWF